MFPTIITVFNIYVETGIQFFRILYLIECSINCIYLIVFNIIKYFIVTIDLFNMSFLKHFISLYIFYLTDYTLLDGGILII